jgi:hypothetical protein
MGLRAPRLGRSPLGRVVAPADADEQVCTMWHMSYDATLQRSSPGIQARESEQLPCSFHAASM